MLILAQPQVRKLVADPMRLINPDTVCYLKGRQWCHKAFHLPSIVQF